MIARAVFDAVTHPRREVWIGTSTLKVILGNMLLPAFLDRYLAKGRFQGKETPQPVESDRKDNLMTPVASLHRTRGRFGKEAGDHAVVATGSVARIAPVLIGGSCARCGNARCEFGTWAAVEAISGKATGTSQLIQLFTST